MNTDIAYIKQLTTHYDLLPGGLSTADRLWDQLDKHLSTIQAIQFKIKTLEDVQPLARFLVQIFSTDRPIQLGIEELLLNAIEHGNLGITYEEKGALLEAQQWESEIQRRQALPKNQSKCVCVRFQRYPDKCTLSIEDEGQGFDWSDHLEISPQKLTHSHGRGIALANSISFDSLTYLGKGNQVVGTLLTPPSSAP